MNKKILVFCPYYPPHVGGLENFSEELNLKLADRNYNVTVFTPNIPNVSSDYEMVKGTRVFRYPAWNIIPNYPVPCFFQVKFWKMFSLVSNDKYNYVISHTRFFISTFIAGLWAKKNKCQWVHVEHGSDFVQLKNIVKSSIAILVDYTLGKWVFSEADNVIAVSAASANFCKKIYSKRKYKIIYRGINFCNFKKNKISNKNNKNTYIMFVGRLIDGKGVDVLIRAMSVLSKMKWTLYIVGDGPQKKQLENLSSKYKLDKKIRFTGQMNKIELSKMYNMVDIVVNPSLTEGLPTVLLEAATHGKAIVATNVGGTSEIIDDGISGLLVEPGDAVSLSNKIKYLLTNHNFGVKIGNSVYKKVYKKFNWETSVLKFIQILK